jgi:hypothetical protein
MCSNNVAYQAYRGAQSDEYDGETKHETDAVKQRWQVARPGSIIDGGSASQVSQVGRHHWQYTWGEEGEQTATEC